MATEYELKFKASEEVLSAIDGAFPGGIIVHIKDGEKDAQTEAEQKPE